VKRRTYQALMRKVFDVQKAWASFHDEVTDALVANGAKRGEETGVGSDRIGVCPAIDKAMADCEATGSDDCGYGPSDPERTEVLCKVVMFMLARERPKFDANKKACLQRHWPDLIEVPVEPPQRRHYFDQA
jgi:hypothetical protein